MVHIKKFFKVSNSAPTQWFGITDDNRGIYIRYRNSNLEVVVGNPPAKSHPSSSVVVDKEVESDNYTSRMNSGKLIAELKSTEVNVDHRSEKPQDNELEEVRNNMSEYINNIEVNN